MAVMNNKKFDKSQVIVLFVLLLLLIFIPLLPSSMKPTYLYFIFNVLIIALGAEAGLLSAFSHPNSEDRMIKPVLPYQSEEEEAIQEPQKKEETNYNASEQNYEKKQMKVLEKSSSEKIVVADKVVDGKMKKCVSVPSLFYIGGDEEESDSEEEIIEEDEVVGQELFANAEAFIGNFYKQLKMQREISQRNFSRMNKMCC